MKKMLLFACMIFAAISAFAQDIIITRDARRVEATITEVSDTEIKYKEFNNPKGPLYIMQTTDINTIMYQNGTIKVYDNTRKSAPGAAVIPSAQDPNSLIVKKDNYYLLGDQQMDEAQYVEFIKANCAAAYEAYEKANNLRQTGFKLLGSGIGISAGGVTVLALGGILSGVLGSNVPMIPCGIIGGVFTGVGGGLLIGSIPCLVIGSVKKNNSYEVYNENCSLSVPSTAKLEFNLQSSQDGLGIAMRF